MKLKQKMETSAHVWKSFAACAHCHNYWEEPNITAQLLSLGSGSLSVLALVDLQV